MGGDDIEYVIVEFVPKIAVEVSPQVLWVKTAKNPQRSIDAMYQSSYIHTK